jgi:SAM-dependent methyltransferase
VGAGRVNAPLPPAELVAYTYGVADLEGVLERYEREGTALHDVLVDELGPEWSWEGKRVLDFGCGAGRVLRQFWDIADVAELHGAELNEACVGWLERNLSPPVRVARSSDRPPLPYPDEHFDLVWAIWVFTHLSDTWAAWLLELRRILKPGGTLIASLMGTGVSEQLAREPWDADRIGMTVLGHGQPWTKGGPSILHSEWWIRAHWGRAFTVEDFHHLGTAPDLEDFVKLRREDRPAPTEEELHLPEPDEPRELRAALHAIALTNRERGELQHHYDAVTAAYQTEARRRESAEARATELEQQLRGARGGLVRRLGRRARSALRARRMR